MKKLVLSVLTLILLQTSIKSEIIYIDPLPGSKYVNINNGIIIGLDQKISSSIVLSGSIISVQGSKSGYHTGRLSLTSGNKKILFKPDSPFSFNEKVTIKINSGEPILNGLKEYTFQTQANQPVFNPENIYEKELLNYNSSQNQSNRDAPPLDFPEISVSISNNPAPGKIFMSNFAFDSRIPNTPYLIIAENSGIPYASIQVPMISLDFKKQPNGNLTYFSQATFKFYELDVIYNKIDSFKCGNGYVTDEHELRLLSNGHALIIGNDPETVDMSMIVTGGNPNAVVYGIIIQELDENKNVVFQWRTWDHFNIVDAIHQNLLAESIDYVHTNAIELDNDGNIIISSRHLDEITKINRATGDMIWRWGGVHNQFTFVNDSLKFNYQHAVRRIANGNITIFDNGNFNSHPFSRAVEYSLDEVNKVATQVWEYRHSQEIFGPAMGYVQRLSNGNTLISWGATNPSLTEVTPSGEIALEMTLPDGIFSYRALKDSWEGSPIAIDPVSNIIPKLFSLDQNYPNPFNPSTTIGFSIPNQSFVNITLFDEAGRQIASVVNDEYNPGKYSVKFDASNFSSGVYFYRITAGSFVQTNKMVLIK